MLARYRDGAESQPDELTASVVLMKAEPGHRGPLLAIRGLYAGEAREAVRAMRPLVQAAGRPLVDGFRPMAYAAAGALGGTAPRQFELLADLPDAAIEAVVDAAGRPESPADAVEVRHWGGAIARPGPDAGPAGHREVPFSITVDGPARAAGRLRRYATGGSFLNFLHDAEQTHTAYTAANHALLRDIKRAHDPDNVFGLTHNIQPTPAETARGARSALARAAVAG